jgi:phenylacetate-CoA ligase
MSTLKQKLVQQFYTVSKPGRTQYLNELGRFQWLSRAELEALQTQKLQNLLEYAYKNVPYYHALFDRIGFQPADFARDPATFQHIPPLNKALIRQNFEQLLTTDPARRRHLVKNKTSGSSGEPLVFLQDEICIDRVNAHMYRHMQWSGWQLGEPQGWIWGNILAGAEAEQPSLKQKIRDWLVSQTRLNSYLLTPQTMARFATQLQADPGAALYGYASCIYQFAKFLTENNRSAQIQLKSIFTSAEVLYPAQRSFIEEVFGCRVFNIYGSEEMGPIGGECELHTGLHLNPESVYVEVVKNGQAVPDGEDGELILTNLNSHGFPFIRYQIQDWGCKSLKSCGCGRGLPLLDVIHGRSPDLFKTRDGKMTWGGFAGRMLAVKEVKKYQFIQKSYDLIVARIVQASPVDPQRLAEIQKAAKIALGENVEVKFEFVDEILPHPSGKHRYFISELVD